MEAISSWISADLILGVWIGEQIYSGGLDWWANIFWGFGFTWNWLKINQNSSKNGQIYTKMVKFSKNWSKIIKNGQIFIKMDKYSPKRLNLGKIGQK